MAPILPWQWLFLCTLCGLLFVQWPSVSLLVFVIILTVNWTLKLSLKKILGLSLAYILGLALGITAMPSQPHNHPPEQKINITATISEVRLRSAQKLVCILSDIKYSSKKLNGKLAWTWQDPQQIPVKGQKISLNLKVKPIHGLANFGCWSSEQYWRRQGVFWRAYSKGKTNLSINGQQSRLQQLRGQIRNYLLEIWPEGAARALGPALLLGERLWLDYKLQDRIRRASLAHSLALSGMHVGFVALLGWGLSWLLGIIYPKIYLYLPQPKLAVILATPLVIFYLWLGASSPSLLRASIMFACWGILLLLNQNRILLDGLFVALALILIFEPLAIFDISLQLSALAVIGIALLLPVLNKINALFAVATNLDKFEKIFLYFKNCRSLKKICNFSLSYICLSLASNISLAPILLWNFNSISPHIYLNILWLPVLGLVVMPLLFGGLLLSFIPILNLASPTMLKLGGNILQIFGNSLRYLDNANLLQVDIWMRPRLFLCLAYWLGLMLAILYFNRHQTRKKLRTAISLLMLTSLIIGLTQLLSPLKNTQLVLTLLDTGMSQAVLVELPQGKRVLIDGGGFWNWSYDVGKMVLTPALTWGRFPELQQVILSHDDVDHRRGLIFILQNFEVGKFVWNGRKIKGRDGELIRSALQVRKIPAQALKQGDKIILAENISLEVIWPPADFRGGDNDSSLVLRLVWNGQGMVLIPGDIENKGLKELLFNNPKLRAKLMLLPHHGSRGSLEPELYEKIKPKLALGAAGFKNRFNFPHREVVDFCKQQKIKLMTTAQYGAIRISWANSTAPMQVQTVRKRSGQ